MSTFEHNFSTFDKLKPSSNEDEKYLTLTNLSNEEKSKKGLSDLTNLMQKVSKPNIPLKNTKKSSFSDNEPRIYLEIANLHFEITNKIKNSSSSFLQGVLTEDEKKGVHTDPISQLQEVFQIIIAMGSGRDRMKDGDEDLTEEDIRNYDDLLQQLEGEIKNHIGMENQLRNYGETIKAQLEECEKNYNQKKISPIVEKIKKENNLKKEDLKKKQQEIDGLNKELQQKNELIKTQAEKLKSFKTFPEKSPVFQNSFIEQKLENKKNPSKNLKNEEIINPDALIEKESRRKSSVSSVSGSNRSIPQNSLKSSNFEFMDKNTDTNKREITESSFLKKNFDGLSEREKGILEYFQSKLNERDEQVNFLQNQIKSLMNNNTNINSNPKNIQDRKINDTLTNENEEDDYKNDYYSKANKQIKPIFNEPKRNEIKAKSSLSSFEKAYLATDRLQPRESFLEQEKSLITTDRNHVYNSHKNTSFHNDTHHQKDINKTKIQENIKANKHLLQEKSQKELKSNGSLNQLKNNVALMNNNNNFKNKESEDDLNSKYFLKIGKSKSPIKQDYRNYECAEKKRDLSAINNKNLSETQRINNEQLGKNDDGKKGSYIDFLNKNRKYLFQD